MKVLAIVSSARKVGNSEILAKEMLAALPDSVEKKVLRLEDFRIEPCRACYACLTSGKDCIIPDDLASILHEIQEADAIILASPVYFLGMHTRLKLLCDRLISVMNEGEKYAGRRCVVAVPYGVADWQGYGVEATVSVARFLHLDVVGVLPVRAANPGEAVRPEILGRARELAGRLLSADAASPDSGDATAVVRQSTEVDDIACPVCGSGILRISTDGGLRCAICGTIGNLRATPAVAAMELQPAWTATEHFRYSAAGMAEHARRLEAIKADFMSHRQELLMLRKPYRDT